MTKGAQTPYSFDMRDPSLVDVLAAARRATELDLKVCFPASVTEVIDGGARVKVVPDVRPVLQTDTGEQVLHPIEITNLPVLTYGQGTLDGGYLRFPVQFADKGLVIVTDRSLSAWYEEGREAPPEGYQTHNAADGVFLPGLRYRSIGLSDNDPAAVLENSLIKIGAGATQGAARLNDSVSAGATMIQWINSVIAAFASFGVTIPPPTDFGIISEASTKVTIE
jgi:hypothetical protein